MAALNQDRPTMRKDDEYAAYPVKANTKIYAGSLVMLDATGFAVPGSDTAGCMSVGVARARADNTGGADGDITVEVWREDCFEFACAGMAVTDVGKVVYLVDDQTVGLAATTNNDIPCGVIAEFISATSVMVDIERRA